MGNTISYPYSKKNSWVTLGVMLVLGLLFTSNIFKAYHNNDRIDVIFFALLLSALVFVLVILIAKRLIPALNNDIILEFNEKYLTDYLRNVTINWQDIETITIKRTRSSSMIRVKLKWESDHGSEIFISLRWVTGKDRDIYETALLYFNKFADTGIIAEE